MPFVLYEKIDVREQMPRVPTVSFLKCGKLYLNQKATKLMGDATSIDLYWDADTKVIGIKPGGCRALYQMNNNTAGIAVRGFCRWFGITVPEISVRNLAHWDEDEEMLTFTIE